MVLIYIDIAVLRRRIVERSAYIYGNEFTFTRFPMLHRHRSLPSVNFCSEVHVKSLVEVVVDK